MSRTRGTWNTRGTWLAGAALAAVLALTGYAVISGGDGDSDTAGKGGSSPNVSSSPSAVPTYQVPDDWTEPDRWAALPRGARTDKHGSEVGFPQSTEGALGMAAAANRINIENGRSTVDEQLRIYYSYVDKADQSSNNAKLIEQQALQTDKSLAQEMGVKPGSPLPSGAYMRNTVIGYKVIKKSSDEVSVWLLARATQKTGETAKESSSYTRTLNAVVWEDGDWKLSGAATTRAQQDAAKQTEPKIVAPGDEDFNDAGWTAIREAS